MAFDHNPWCFSFVICDLWRSMDPHVHFLLWFFVILLHCIYGYMHKLAPAAQHVDHLLCTWQCVAEAKIMDKVQPPPAPAPILSVQGLGANHAVQCCDHLGPQLPTLAQCCVTADFPMRLRSRMPDLSIVNCLQWLGIRLPITADAISKWIIDRHSIPCCTLVYPVCYRHSGQYHWFGIVLCMCSGMQGGRAWW